MRKTLFALFVFLTCMSNIPMCVISGNVDGRASVVIEYGDAWDKYPPQACEFSTRNDAQKFRTFSNKNGKYYVVVPEGWSGIVRPQPIVRRYPKHVVIKEWYTPCLGYNDVQENHLWQNYIIDDGTPKW